VLFFLACNFCDLGDSPLTLNIELNDGGRTTTNKQGQ
jgi:hypothetical protein